MESLLYPGNVDFITLQMTRISGEDLTYKDAFKKIQNEFEGKKMCRSINSVYPLKDGKGVVFDINREWVYRFVALNHKKSDMSIIRL